jgi:hypothetical protein
VSRPSRPRKRSPDHRAPTVRRPGAAPWHERSRHLGHEPVRAASPGRSSRRDRRHGHDTATERQRSAGASGQAQRETWVSDDDDCVGRPHRWMWTTRRTRPGRPRRVAVLGDGGPGQARTVRRGRSGMDRSRGSDITMGERAWQNGSRAGSPSSPERREVRAARTRPGRSLGSCDVAALLSRSFRPVRRSRGLA